MKGLKEFLEALKEDEALRSEVEKVQDDAAKVVEVAKKHGYSFTEDEYNELKMEAVSGGGLFGYAVTGLQAKLFEATGHEDRANFHRMMTGHPIKKRR